MTDKMVAIWQVLSLILQRCIYFFVMFLLLDIFKRYFGCRNIGLHSTNTSLQFTRFSEDMQHLRRKRRRSDPVLWQNPLCQQKIRKTKDNTQTPPKSSITQRLWNDSGRLVGVTSHPTGVIKPVYGYPTLPLTTKAVLSKRHTFKNL